MTQTTKLMENIKNKITKDESEENVLHFENKELVIVHFNIFNIE